MEKRKESHPAEKRKSSGQAWLPSPGPLGILLTFKIEVGPTLQEDSSCPSQPQLSHLQQGIAHAFLVERRVGLLLQQLGEDQDAALLAGGVTAHQRQSRCSGNAWGPAALP